MPETPVVSEPTEHIARRLTLSGRVQGLGVRPAIARLAVDCGIRGTVSNRLDGVVITLEGTPAQLTRFRDRLPQSLPETACIDQWDDDEVPWTGRTEFSIEESPCGGPVSTQVPRDQAVCSDCVAELADERDRRCGYPLISCAACGPRYSIITSMPYERSRTEMARFTLCARCQAEYTNPADRRFHAQTNACQDCGPQIWCGERGGRLVARNGEALRAAVDGLQRGLIIALRGLGGYQLLCDATSDSAVARLRERKRRSKKPLAVMVADFAAAERLAEIDGVSRTALVSAENPIVVLRARAESGLAAALHPGLDTVGVMLPGTPLHWLLSREFGKPLVVTSGNREGEPLAIEVAESLDTLKEIADLWLHHDRQIAHPLDDSVVRIIAGRPVTLRLARGMAPLPLELPSGVSAAALGGHQKVAIAISNGVQAVLGPHIGDLAGTKMRERFTEQVQQTLQLYGATAPRWIHDLHPDYFTTHFAQDQKGGRGVVQHHHAHVAAVMLEQGWLDREVLGVACDGSGYGANGTVWGGEFLLATVASYRRVGHLREFHLIGGEAAIREPWKIAVALLQQAAGPKSFTRVFTERLQERATRLLPLLNRPQVSPRTTSAGRLFDAVAAVVLGLERSEYEGYPAMLLEAVADRNADRAYTFLIEEGDPLQVDWRPMMKELVSDVRKKVPPGTMAMRFHRGLAEAIAVVCRQFSPRPVVLGGGVFQNQLLTELIVDALAGGNQQLGLPGRIPPNDGGLAAGQLAVALAPTVRKGI